MIHLRAPTNSEFESWLVSSKKNYAEEKAKAGLTPEDAKAESDRSFQRLLPDGHLSKNQHFFTIVETSSEAPVGMLWWGVKIDGSQPLPWIYDIILNESMRGKGYGRLTMLAAEKSVLAAGYRSLGLHVFGHNLVARKLYDSLGFQTTDLVMRKDL